MKLKRILILLCAAVCFLTMLITASAAEREYLLTLDFEQDDPGTAPTQSALFACVPLKASLKIEKVGDRKVLAFRREPNIKTNAYIDLMTGSKKFLKIYTISYEIMLPDAKKSAGTWQIACSRQTPSAGTQFQQAGSLNLDTGEIMYAGKAVGKLDYGQWHTLAAVFDEYRSIFDVYLDGNCVIAAAPYTINTAAAYPERLRIGQNEATGECLVYVDNVKIYNAAVPDGIPAPEVVLLATEEEPSPADAVVIPTWTRTRDVNTIIVTAVGSVSIVLVGIIGAVILLRGRKRGRGTTE